MYSITRLFAVHPTGVEPISSESESDILSIILRMQNWFANLGYYIGEDKEFFKMS